MSLAQKGYASFHPLCRLEPDLLNKLLAVFGLHEHGCAVAAGLRYQFANAELIAAILTLELNLKTLNGVILKKILQHHHCLRTAIAVRFARHRDLYIVIYILGNFLGITGTQGSNYIFKAANGRKSGSKKK